MVVSKSATLQSVNPATRETLGEVPIMNAAQVKEAVDSAWAAFDSWQLTEFHAAPTNSSICGV